MILKKYQARRLKQSSPNFTDSNFIPRKTPLSGSGNYADLSSYDLPENAVYENRPLSPELFEAGALVDRRRHGERRDDRRQDFRRNEDHGLLSTAETEGKSIRQQAKEEGYELGLNEGRMIIFELKEQIEAFLSARDEALSSASQEIAGIAINVVKHILKTEVSCDPTLVVSFVKRAIKETGKQHKSISIRVHPGDYNLLNKTFETTSPVMGNVDLDLVEDDAVDPGSCIIETVSGQVDKRFSTQLEVLSRLITQSEIPEGE